MDNRTKTKFFKPIGRRLNTIGSTAVRRGAGALFRPESSNRMMNGIQNDSLYDDDHLAPVMPAIDAVQQLIEEERKKEIVEKKSLRRKRSNNFQNNAHPDEPNEFKESSRKIEPSPNQVQEEKLNVINKDSETKASSSGDNSKIDQTEDHSSFLGARGEGLEVEEEPLLLRRNPLSNFANLNLERRNEEFEFIPKSVILDIYSNDPEVKRFLKQLPKIGAEFGYNEQDYKCYSCRRPIGLVFGQSRLCQFDGHHYCPECHLGEKATIPARILCNWDFNKYPISKRNQHFLTLISNEPMFEIKNMAPLLYKHSQELREVEELRCQAFFIRSYCFTCVQDSISFELTKLVWPREHLIKQIDLYSLEDLIQIKSGSLKQVLKNVINFGRQHVLSCVLCCQKGFICELCKSSQIIYPFDTESVHRCNSCQSIYHKICFKSKPNSESCPRCQRLKARRHRDS